MRWATLADELARGKSLPGILPIEDVLLYGQESLLLVAHFQMIESTWSWNMCHALERLTCAFEALSCVHNKRITINLWPEKVFQDHEISFASSYVLPADDPKVKDWIPYGSLASSDEPKFAEIAGRRFPCRFVTRFPPPPEYAFQYPNRPFTWSGPWTPFKASVHPLVPCAPLVSQMSPSIKEAVLNSSMQLLWNFLWSSSDDRCDRTFPLGQRYHHDWEASMLEQDDPSAHPGTIHEKPWDITTERRYAESRSPEESALCYDETEWHELSTSLPYDRFKRDVHNLASYFLHSNEWEFDRVETQKVQLKDERISLVISGTPTQSCLCL